MAHSGEAAAFAVEKTTLVKTDANHADGMNDYRASAPAPAVGKSEAALITGVGKPLPAVELYDFTSQSAAGWSSLDGYSLATERVDPLAQCLGSKEAEREAVLKTEAERLAGAQVTWPAEKCAAELELEKEKEKSPSAEHSRAYMWNHSSIYKHETPTLNGTANWANLEGYTLANP